MKAKLIPLMFKKDDFLRRRVRAARRLVSSPEAIWQRALPEEVSFWQRYIETKGLAYPDEFRHRLDPAGTINDQYVLDAIDKVGGEHVRILDVGSGPLTSVGVIDPRDRARRIEVTPIDPLADQYGRLLARADCTPPVRTIQCRGEDIATVFAAGSFDIAAVA
jgi:hypothetical protein